MKEEMKTFYICFMAIILSISMLFGVAIYNESLNKPLLPVEKDLYKITVPDYLDNYFSRKTYTTTNWNFYHSYNNIKFTTIEGEEIVLVNVPIIIEKQPLKVEK